MHRMHHAFADTENDPHSPKYDETIFNMMWKTKTIYSKIASGQEIPDKRFTNGVPRWDFFDKFARSWPSRLFWGASYVAVYYFFASEIWLWVLLPIQFLFSPIHGAIINWFAHKYGYRNYEVKDTSRNILPFDFLMMGESYHNNHHKYGSRPNFGGIRWHEIDPTYQVIKLLKSRKPKSLEVCCLLNKFSRRETNIESKWVGFDIPDEFVIGYGIDYAQQGRNLPHIGAVKACPKP